MLTATRVLRQFKQIGDSEAYKSAGFLLTFQTWCVLVLMLMLVLVLVLVLVCWCWSDGLLVMLVAAAAATAACCCWRCHCARRPRVE